MAEELTLSGPHLKLAALAWGPADGIPVLALHGWLDNAASFAGVGPLLNGIRLVALDLPGHGRSEHRPPGVHYHFVDYVPDVLAAADALGWDQFALLGHSLGAGVASFTTAAAQERVTRLALLEGLGPLSFAPSENPVALAASMQQMASHPGRRRVVYKSLEEAARIRSNGRTRVPLAAAMLLARRGTGPANGGVAWCHDPRLAFRSPLYCTEEQVLAFLDCIRAPTLVVIGEDGYLNQRDFMPGRYQRIAGLEKRTLPGGHHLHMEYPAPVAAALETFLKASPAPGR